MYNKGKEKKSDIYKIKLYIIKKKSLTNFFKVVAFKPNNFYLYLHKREN